jgi:glycosyltransferase involved in cell wall biosynthesis
VVERTRAIVPDAEVLVVDDCSSDDTAARAEAAGAGVIRRPYTPESWLTVGPARE